MQKMMLWLTDPFMNLFSAPFLKEDKKNRCIIISLYGLESISDISKSIYMELRIKKLKKDSEMRAAGKVLTKTIFKNMVGILGIDANMSEDDLQDLYSSIDLSGKLLIFEDLERSNIDLITVLGYINNLVERDGVKVLLVANEDEILNKVPKASNFDIETLISLDSENNDKEDDKNNISEDVQKYLRIKEKTVSDTIYFESDYYKGIKNILTIFENTKI